MRPEKASIVSDLSEKLNRSPFLLVTDYQRMKVDQFSELRNRLAPTGAQVHVVKNSFLKRAMTASGLPDVAEQLSGQTALVTGDKDVAPVAKVLKTFAAEFKVAAVKIGVVDKSVLSTAEVESLADLPRAKSFWRSSSVFSRRRHEIGPHFERAGGVAGATLERQSREGSSTGRGGSLTTRISPRICGTSNEEQQHCPSRWLSAVISRRLSGAAIGGKQKWQI
jgi:large subunit ribosomal protein L10